MIEFNDIDFRNHGPEGCHHPCEEMHHHPCEEMHPHPCPPPFNPELKKLFDLAAHADRIAHKALELARYANLDSTSAKKLAEQALAITNRVSTVAEKANTKSDRALAEIEVLKDEVENIFTKLTNIQKGAGLSQEGNYIKNESANYISTATSLADADNKLDSAVKEVNDSVSLLSNSLSELEQTVNELANEVEQLSTIQSNIISAVGLKPDGNYKKSGNSVINSARSVLEATEKLAEKIEEVEEASDSITDAVEDMQNDIAENTSAIQSLGTKVQTISNKVNQVEGRVDSLESSMAPTHALAEQANQRVSVVEGRVDTLTGNVATLQGNVSSLQNAVTANSNDITNLETSIGNIALSKTGELEYTLMVNGHAAGKINIPQDQFLQQVHYDPATKMLTFTFVDGTTIQPIYIGDLVDTYTAGNGINISGSQISAKIDSQSEPFLSATANGLKLSGIQAAIDKRYQAGVGLKRSAQPNTEDEYVFDVQIQENSRPYLSADVDGIGIDINALKQEIGPFDPSTLAGNHLVYDAVNGTLNVNVSSLVSDPTFINAVTEIVQSALLWEPKEGAAGVIQPKNNKSVYVNGTIEAAGSIYSGS